MANHLTPEELSKEVGIERDEVIRICIEEHVPIYQGKIDKTLFQAQLAAISALPPQALSAGAGDGLLRRVAGALARRARASRRLLRRRLLRACALRRDRGAERLHQVDRPAPRLGVGSGAASSWPSSFASSSSRSDARYSLRSSAGSNVALEARDDLARERELLLLHRRRGDRLVDLVLALHVLGDEERLERERVALRPDQAELLLAGEHERAERRRRRPRASPRAGARRAGAAPRCRPGRGSRCGRSRRDRPRPPATKRVISIAREVSRCSSASSSASSTGTNWPFATSQPRTSSSGPTSTSCTGHQRFCLIGVRHSRCSILNCTSDWRADDAVAGASPTGMLTRPKLIDPFQVVRMCR